MHAFPLQEYRRKRQDSERKRAVARVILWLPC
jgi:hypothetical protein